MDMSVRSLLSDNFDFDLWANLEWLPIVESHATETERGVFGHILSASDAWLQRVNGVSPTSMPKVPIDEASLRRLHSGWLAKIETLDAQETISFQRTTGEAHARAFGDICRHVVNHGTYHRGQLRGMFGDRGSEAFPETDLIRYSFLRPAEGGG